MVRGPITNSLSYRLFRRQNFQTIAGGGVVETDHACLYVSELGFSLEAGGSMSAHLSGSERILALAVLVAGVRAVDGGRRERVVERGECAGRDDSAGGRETEAPFVAIIYRHLRSRRGVSPPLLRSRIRRSCRLSRAGSGANWQLLSSDESDERPKEASTVIKEAVHFVRAYGNSAFYCVVGDGSDRDRGQRYEGVESTKPSVRMEKKWW